MGGHVKAVSHRGGNFGRCAWDGLLAGLKTLRDDVEFQGIGGPLSAGRGLNSLFPMSDLSVMGLTEVLPRCVICSNAAIGR